jgi:hypothetical protein
VERDEHSSAGHGAGDRTRILGNGLSPEAESSPDAPPSADDAQDAAPDQTAPEQASRPDPEPGVRPDAIMSKLPRTRPQRVTGRRHREPGRNSAAAERTTAAKRTAVQTGGSASRSAPGRPKSRAGTAARAAKQGTTAARATRPSEVANRRRPTTEAPRAPKTRVAPPPRSGSGSPPGLPRLAIDGAVEAAKLPLKVGGRLTLRALDAVARGLRGD